MKKNRSILSDLAHIIGTYWQVFFSCKQTKLCVLFSLFAACIFVPQKTYSQSLDDKITFELHNQPLHKGLKQLGEISGFKLAYTIQQVEKYKSVSVEKGTRSVEATLKLLLAKTDLNYTLKSNTILLTAPVSSNRKRKVTGVITDKNDIPVLGVTIRDSGTNTAVVSNMNGYYSIEVPEATTLIYSFVGMHPIIEEIGNRNSINVRMSEEINELKGVEIVSTGYQSLPKERVTGSFVQISSKDLKMTPTINIMERIEGMVPGVNVDVRNNKITIRGKNTYYTPTKSYPLIVIDGFPFIEDELTKPANGNLNGSAVGVTGNSVLSRINPEDIESITILKDAAAASIWGARAANGVIVIETKKGKQGTPNVTFTTNISVSAPADLKKLDRMNSAQYIALERELKENGFLSDPIANYYPSWMPFNYNAPLSDAAEWMFKVDRGTATAEEAETALAAMSKINNYDQIKKYLLQKAISQQYNLSLSGGGPTNTYYISSNYSKDIPVFRSNNAESYFVTANQGNSFLDNRINLKTGISYNYTNSKNNQAAINALGSTTMGLRPYDLLVDENGKTIQHSILFTQGVADDFLSKGYLPWTYSPLDELNYSNTITKTNRIQLNASLEAKLTYWLSVSVSGSYQKKSGTSNILDELNSYVGRSMINTATTIDETSGKLVYNIPYGGKLITTNNDGEDYSYRGQFNINKIWKNKMSLTMLGGAEARQSKTTAYQQTRYGFVEDTYTSQAYSPSASYNTVYGWTSTLAYSDSQISKATTRFLSYYTNGAVGFKDEKYILSASARFDDYTLVGRSRSERAKPLWSVGTKWNAKAENFLHPITWLDNLNLRFTVGLGGLMPESISNVAILSVYGSDYVTNETYGTITSPANGKVSWEKTTQYNLGLDWGMFNNRFKGTFEIYKKDSKDILVTLPANTTYGWNSLQRNAATMTGHGFDLGISGTVVSMRHFSWLTSFNISYNTNKVTDSRFVKPTSYSSLFSGTPIVDMPLDYLYAYRWAGLDNTGQSQIYDSQGNIVSPNTSNAVLKPEDLKYMGRTTAPYFGGFTNTFRYKGLSLNMHITYAIGHVFRRPSIDNYPQWSGTYSGVIGSQKDLAYRWQKPGDEATTNVPGLANISYNSFSRYKYSDILTEKASNVRLRQISLNYSFPTHLLTKTMFKSLTASVAARNLGLLWVANKKGIDPDYIATNNYSNLPPSKSYYFSLNLTF